MSVARPVVLDASALLAFLHGEPGEAAVARVLDGAAMTTVNWSEVVQKSRARGVDVSGLDTEVRALGVTFESFKVEDAYVTAEIWTLRPRSGLSLADRACLALAKRLGAVAVTADRSWSSLRIGVPVRAIR